MPVVTQLRARTQYTLSTFSRPSLKSSLTCVFALRTGKRTGRGGRLPEPPVVPQARGGSRPQDQRMSELDDVIDRSCLAEWLPRKRRSDGGLAAVEVRVPGEARKPDRSEARDLVFIHKLGR